MKRCAYLVKILLSIQSNDNLDHDLLLKTYRTLKNNAGKEYLSFSPTEYSASKERSVHILYVNVIIIIFSLFKPDTCMRVLIAFCGLINTLLIYMYTNHYITHLPLYPYNIFQDYLATIHDTLETIKLYGCRYNETLCKLFDTAILPSNPPAARNDKKETTAIKPHTQPDHYTDEL